MGGVGPGWYPDYEAPPGHERYWDGERWTARRSATPRRRGPARWVVAGVVALVLVGAVAIVLGTRETGRSSAEPPQARASEPGAVTPAAQHTWLVSAVVDGTTLQLDNGAQVRLLGIADGCAADTLGGLVVGERVTLTRRGADKDAAGRLLRYVERDGVDVGKRLLQLGLATAAEEPNPRRAIYRRVDERSPDRCS